MATSDAFTPGQASVATHENAADPHPGYLTPVEGDAAYTKRASVATYAARVTRTSGDITLNSTTWADVNTGLDLVLSAVTGDWVEVGLCANLGSETVVVYLDAVSIVSGSPVNAWGDDAAGDSGTGNPSWISLSGGLGIPAGSVIRQLQAGDISGGTVTIRLRYKQPSATNRTLFATTVTPLAFWARNHG